jgi:predicted transposase YdaD
VAKKADIGGKRLLGLAPDTWARWVTQQPDVIAQEILEELVELESLLGFFASFVLDTELVSQLMRWDMTVLRESPWYQEILQEGRKDGIQEGEQRGLEHERSLILRLLTRRIGAIAPAQETKIRNLSLTQLEELGEALLDFSQASALEDWLNAHSE